MRAAVYCLSLARRATKTTWGLKQLSSEGRLRELVFFNLEKAPGELHSSLQRFEVGYQRRSEVGLLKKACSDRIKSNGFKQGEGQFR